jgi:DNA replicative helicase MCM subunit Mcm2 (Cdc46/Mcm family)
VQLIQSSERKTEKTPKKTDVSHEILAVLREAGGTSAVKEILSRFEARGVNQTSVEDSLDKLMQSGTIFEPRPGVVSIV